MPPDAMNETFSIILVRGAGRDRNHPSVVIWSCGNESLTGTVILEDGHIRFLPKDPEQKSVSYPIAYQKKG